MAVATVRWRTGGGEWQGQRANAFTGVPMEPPLVLVCVDKSISSYPAMVEADGFLINILTDQQEELARRFATPDIDKFEGVETGPGDFGAARIPRCLAYISARPHAHSVAAPHPTFIRAAT